MINGPKISAPFCRLFSPVVGTILKPRATREFPELGLIVTRQKTAANDNFTTGKNADATLLKWYHPILCSKPITLTDNVTQIIFQKASTGTSDGDSRRQYKSFN